MTVETCGFYLWRGQETSGASALLIASLLIIGCTTADSDHGAEAVLSEPLVVLARHIAESKGTQRYVVSSRVFCDDSETCPDGEILWSPPAFKELLHALHAAPAPPAAGAIPRLGQADMVLAFGPVEIAGPDSATINFRSRYQGGMSLARAHLKRRSGSWQVDRTETLVVGTIVDTLIQVRKP